MEREDSVVGEGSSLTRGTYDDRSQRLTLFSAMIVRTNLKSVSYKSRGEKKIKVRHLNDLTGLVILKLRQRTTTIHTKR